MSDDLTLKIVNALKKYADSPQPAQAGVSIRNLTVHIDGGVHFHTTKVVRNVGRRAVPGMGSSRRQLIHAIHVNAGRYFLKGQFNRVLKELFDVSDLNIASTEQLRAIWDWSLAWQKEVITGTDD